MPKFPLTLAPFQVKSCYISCSENQDSQHCNLYYHKQFKMQITKLYGMVTILMVTVNGMTTQNYREYCSLTTSQGRRVCSLCSNHMVFEAVPTRVKHTCGVLVKAGCCQMLTNMF